MSEQRAKENRVPKQAVFIFLLMAVGYLYSSLQRVSGGVVLPHMAQAYGFSAGLTGFLSSIFFYSYGGLQNVWGAINDRYGPLKSCSIGFAITAFGSLLIIVSHSPFFIGLSRLVCGAGLASIFTGIYLYAALAFPVAQYPFWVGCIMVAGNSGAVVAVSPLGWLMDTLGYNGMYLVLSVAALLISSALWLFRWEAPSVSRHESSEADKPAGLANILISTLIDMKHGFSLVTQNHPVLVVVFTWTTAAITIINLQGLWGVSWIMTSSGATLTDARFWTTVICIGTVVGAPFGSKITVYTNASKNGMLALLVPICLFWTAFMAASYMGMSAPVLGCIGFITGTLSGAFMVLCTSLLKSLVPISRTGLVIGTGQFLLYMSLILAQWGSGLIIDLFPGNTPGTYLNTGFLAAFGILIAAVWLSMLSVLTVKEFQKEN